MSENNQSQKHSYLKYTLAFFLISLILFLCLRVNNKSLINLGDAADGFYPAFVYIGNYIRNIPNNLFQYQRIPIYDFLIGFGNNIFETIGILGDPFNWLSTFFPGELSVFGYELCIILRLYIAGIGFLIWANRKQLCIGGIFGALTFVFCHYAMNTGIHFYNYLTAFSMFPFVVAGVDDIIERKRKFSGFLLLGITVTVMDGFAFLFMDTVFFAFYIPIKSLFNQKTNRYDRHLLSEMWKDFLISIKHYLIGLGLASPFLIPDLYGHLLSSRSEINFSNLFMQFDFASIKELAKSFISDINYTGGIGIGCLCFFGILYVFSSKKHKDISWILLFVIAGHFILGFHVLMNCFLYAPYAIGRWYYILYFCLGMAVAIGIDEWVKIGFSNQNRRIIILTIFILGYAVFGLYLSIRSGLYSEGNKWLLIATTIAWVSIIYVLIFRPKQCMVILMASCILVEITGVYPVFHAKDDFADLDIYNRVIQGKLAMVSKQDQERGAFRTDLNDSIRMASLITQNPGTRSYYSVQNEGLYHFLRDMACSGSLYGGNVNIGSLDGRKSLEMLMSVGSYADDLENTILHHNYDMMLPIGFAYDSYMLNNESLMMDPLDRSHNVLKTVYLEETPEIDIPKLTKDKIVEKQWKTISTAENDSNNQEDGVHIDLYFSDGEVTKEEDKEYYLYISLIESYDWLSMINIDNMKLLRFTPAGEAANGRGEYLLKLAVNDDVINRGNFQLLSNSSNIHFGSIEVRMLDISEYKDDYLKLSQHMLKNVSVSPDRVTGNLSCDENSILFTSILYDERWMCIVDGKPVTTHKADSGFLAAEIEAGDHEVILEYRTNLVQIGLLVCFLSSAITILLWKNRKGKKCG